MSEHKYTVIVKVCPRGMKGKSFPGQSGGFAKWRTSDLKKLCIFLDNNYPDWCYFNVYEKSSRLKIASFTKYCRPMYKHI